MNKDIFKYNYNMKIFEERINLLNIYNGEAGLEVTN